MAVRLLLLPALLVGVTALLVATGADAPRELPRGKIDREDLELARFGLRRQLLRFGIGDEQSLRDDLEDAALDVGCSATWRGLRLYAEYGALELDSGDTASALRFLEYVADEALPRDTVKWGHIVDAEGGDPRRLGRYVSAADEELPHLTDALEAAVVGIGRVAELAG